MKQITVKHGPGNQVTLEYPDSATVGNVINDHRTRAALGYGDNVAASIFNATQPFDAPAPAGATIVVSNVAAEKAS